MVSNWAASSLPLIPLTMLEEDTSPNLEAVMSPHLRLLSLPALTGVSPVHNAAVLHHPEALVPLLLLGEKLGPTESLRVRNHSLSFIPSPRFPSSPEALTSSLCSLVAGLRPSTAHTATTKSALRRPSVAAVTSAATSSPPLTASSERLSFSDSCAHNKGSDSELSYSLAGAKPERRTKLRKKDTFSERLKAAMARGNTPEESDDASGAGFMVQTRTVGARRARGAGAVHRRAVRRQASTGFRAAEVVAGTESEEFCTATEDELSNMERVSQTGKVEEANLVSSCSRCA